MGLTQSQYELIAPHLPVQRGNVKIQNLEVLTAILYVAEHGCKWRGLPERFGRWHTVYTRMNRWSKSGVLDRVFEQLRKEGIVEVSLMACAGVARELAIAHTAEELDRCRKESDSADVRAESHPSLKDRNRPLGANQGRTCRRSTCRNHS